MAESQSALEALVVECLSRPAASLESAGSGWMVHKSGWLEKQGGKRWKGFKRRWCVLASRPADGVEAHVGSSGVARAAAGDTPCCRLLTYYDGPESEKSNGCICLVDQAYSVSLPKHERSGHPFGIRIDVQLIPGVEQKLKWILAATDEDERQSWLAILGESGAVLSDKIRIAKQLCVQSAE